MPRNLIVELIERVRGDHYEVLRETDLPTMPMVLPHLDILRKIESESCLVRDNSPARDQTLSGLNLRARSGATLLAVRRGSEVLVNPSAEAMPSR